MRQAWRIAMVVAAVSGVPALAAARAHHPIPAPSTALHWPRAQVMDAALRAFACGRAAGYFEAPLLTIIDYTRPSTEPRLWVVDVARRRILLQELVAHGRNSGEDRALAFSDEPGSKMSSIGLFRTGETYEGVHGWALRLDGLEPGFNARARERAIVVHGAAYVSRRSIAKLRRLGRSWGCPAVGRAVSRRLIDRIEGGTALFAYYPDPHWLSGSAFLRCDDAGPAQVVRESPDERDARRGGEISAR
jgi:L,D-transpeptidase catalytic domain